jgi:hypothetical protein
MPVLFYFLTLKPYKMTNNIKMTKELPTGMKKTLVIKLIELLVMQGYSIHEYIFQPKSYYNYAGVLKMITILEQEDEIQQEDSFLNNFPEYKTYFTFE